MALPFAVPPAIARLRNSEHSLYLRSEPRRRMTMLCEYMSLHSYVSNVSDMVALAVAEVRAAYNDRLPPGPYSNPQGHYFEVDRYGQAQELQSSRPQCGLIWLAGLPLRPPPRELLPEFQFAGGMWERLPPGGYHFPFQGAAQQPQVPAFLPYALSGGLVPPLQQLQQQLPPTAVHGNCFHSAAPHQQHPFSAIHMQPPAAIDSAFGLLSADEQPFLPLAADEQHYLNTAPTPGELTFLPFPAEEPTPSLPVADEPALVLSTASEPAFSLPGVDEPTSSVPAVDEQTPSDSAADEYLLFCLKTFLQQPEPISVAPSSPRISNNNGDFLPWLSDELPQEPVTCTLWDQAQQADDQESYSTPAVCPFPEYEAAMCL